MTNRSDISYFGAGPALLPTEVLEGAAHALINHEATGLGLAEHSHRSAMSSEILLQTKKDLATYLDIPLDTYEVLFMQAGGTGEFSATVYNLVAIWVTRRRNSILKEIRQNHESSLNQLSAEDEEALVLSRLKKAVAEELIIDYLVTGSWSLKASQEAIRLLGPEHVNIATDSRENNQGRFGKINHESTWKLSKNPAMTYFCDNETVEGVEFTGFPQCLESTDGEESSDPIIVADMSSNILSRRIPIEKYSLIFFGAQKNLGCTGITVVIIKRNLLPPYLATLEPALMRKLGLPICPIILSYDAIAKHNSLYNTLSIFDVYIAGQVLKRLLKRFPDNKIDGQELDSNEKARLVYAALENHPDLYHIVPERDVRSRMNICFRVAHYTEKTDNDNKNIDNTLENLFLDGATKLGLLGLKGHRSVGGVRASNYNSIHHADIKKLVAHINDFALSYAK